MIIVISKVSATSFWRSKKKRKFQKVTNVQCIFRNRVHYATNS